MLHMDWKPWDFSPRKKNTIWENSFFLLCQSTKKQIQVTNLSNFLGHPAQSTTSTESYMGKSTLQVLSLGDVPGFSIFFKGCFNWLWPTPSWNPPSFASCKLVKVHSKSSKARHFSLAEGEEYWPQGCLTLRLGLHFSKLENWHCNKVGPYQG